MVLFKGTVPSGPCISCTFQFKWLRFSGTPQGHRPGWAVHFLSFPGLSSSGYLVLSEHTVSGGVCVCVGLYAPSLSFLGAPWEYHPRCAVCLLWGAETLSFKPAFSFSFFTLIKKLFNSSSVSAIKLVPSAYLRLLIYLLVILIPACQTRLSDFTSLLLPSSRSSLVRLQFLPLKWYHLHIWGCWYISW